MKNEQKKIIRKICKEFEVTQSELAEMIGVSQGAIKKWSDGSRKIPDYFYKSVEMIRKLREKQ